MRSLNEFRLGLRVYEGWMIEEGCVCFIMMEGCEIRKEGEEGKVKSC